MFKIVSIAAVVTMSFSAQAGQFISANNSVESKVCSVAANEGFEAASKVARANHIHLSKFSATLLCNGEDIRNIAKAQSDNIDTSSKAVQLVADSKDADTALCLKAVQKGVNSLGHNGYSLRCNNLPVKEFVKQYQNAAI